MFVPVQGKYISKMNTSLVIASIKFLCAISRRHLLETNLLTSVIVIKSHLQTVYTVVAIR